MLFSTDMVRAILEDRKTKTRRILNPQPGSYNKELKVRVSENVSVSMCPYGKVGDVIWVRETFANGMNYLLDPNIGKEEKEYKLRYWLFKDGSQLFSDGKYFQHYKKGTEDSFKNVKWKPSIHMPRAACRTLLRIVSVGVERLNNISEEDAIREGIINRGPFGFTAFGIDQSRTGREAFRFLWEHINGKGSWEKNPFVWVVGFERIKKPKTPESNLGS